MESYEIQSGKVLQQAIPPQLLHKATEAIIYYAFDLQA